MYVYGGGIEPMIIIIKKEATNETRFFQIACIDLQKYLWLPKLFFMLDVRYQQACFLWMKYFYVCANKSVRQFFLDFVVQQWVLQCSSKNARELLMRKQL